MTRLMKSEGSYLLIAKVLVISRLVHKALSATEGKPAIVDQLWERLLSVRRKLLRRIDKRLSNTSGETTSLVESLCAYALATSSTPTLVLNHFQKVRLDKMTSELKQGGDELAKHGISALRLCIQTCLDTQTIFPRRLAESLAKLKTHPLIQDTDVRNLYELNLDVHDRWIGDEARNYTPYPRHDELQRPEAERILHRWSKDAMSAFMKGIKKALEGEERLVEVASLRQELIETWILSGSRMAGVKSTNVLDDLRDTMNEKLEAIVQSRTGGLQNVVSELISQLQSLSAPRHNAHASLWDTTSKASDLSNGAQSFKTTILNTYQGRDESVMSVTSAFDSWMESVLEVKGIVKSMKEARWDDTFADDIDDGSDDDDLEESRQTLLSADDPRLLVDATQEAMGEALKNLTQSFAKIVEAPQGGDEDASTYRAVFMLRVVREIGDRIPKLRLQDKSTAFESPFTTDILQPLHVALAAHVVRPSIEAYKQLLLTSSQTSSNSHILWEGSPPLPSQPSSSTFRFLRDLNRSMAAIGSDLWAPGCATVVKSKVSERVVEVLEQRVKNIKAQNEGAPEQKTEQKEASDDKDAPNGEETTESSAELSIPVSTELRDQRLKQLLFDALYIQRFTANKSETDDNTMGLLAHLEDIEDLDDAAVKRLRKNAGDCAKKTYLLFALLA